MTSRFNTNKEVELSERLRSGDPTAVEELFSQYFRCLYSFIFHAVGRDKSIAEDIVQETFLSATKSARRFRGKSKPYTWLLSIAHHKISDHYRKLERERRHIRQNPGQRDTEYDSFPDDKQLLQRNLESTETRSEVERAILSLPQEYREVLLLKYVEEMSVSQISQITARSLKSVEGLLSRARKALRNKIDVQGEG